MRPVSEYLKIWTETGGDVFSFVSDECIPDRLVALMDVVRSPLMSVAKFSIHHLQPFCLRILSHYPIPAFVLVDPVPLFRTIPKRNYHKNEGQWNRIIVLFTLVFIWIFVLGSLRFTCLFIVLSVDSFLIWLCRVHRTMPFWVDISAESVAWFGWISPLIFSSRKFPVCS